MIFILKLTGHKKNYKSFLAFTPVTKLECNLVLQKAHLNVMIPFSNDNTWLKISWYTNFVNKKLLFHKHIALY